MSRAPAGVLSRTESGCQRIAAPNGPRQAAIKTDGGMEAVQLRVAEQYVEQFGKLAKSTNTVIVPATLSDVSGMIAAAMKVFGSVPATLPPPRPPASSMRPDGL